MKEKLISKKKIYKGKIFSLECAKVKIKNGRTAERDIIRHGGAVAIVPFTKSKKILLTKQFRFAINKIVYEIPAGRLEKNETPLSCAKREMMEETGHKIKNAKKLLTFYPCVGYSNEKLHIFTANLSTYTKTNPDFDEIIETFEVPLDKAIYMIKTGKIKDSKTIIALLAVKLKLQHK
ncbi:MAG: NUDIX hydrolase [Candidatus Aureabacteria bacterium]|nr:NUDIX hydrolase [Candidatus Auribacterota bacterium]